VLLFLPARISSLCTLNDLQAVLTRRAIRRDVPVERLPGNAEFGAQVSHLRFLLPHGSHGQAHLWRRHFEGRTAFSSAGAGRSQPGSGSLGNQVSFKLCERSEDAEHELPRRRRGVDRRAVAGEHLETDAAHAEVVNDIDEVAQVAAQPIELPNDQGVPTAQGTTNSAVTGRSSTSMRSLLGWKWGDGIFGGLGLLTHGKDSCWIVTLRPGLFWEGVYGAADKAANLAG
jgi:hypothetical protein